MEKNYPDHHQDVFSLMMLMNNLCLLFVVDAVELVEASHLLPGLKYVKGLETWRVMSAAGDWYDTWDDVPDNLRTIIRPTMFPPSAEEVKSLNLHRA